MPSAMAWPWLPASAESRQSGPGAARFWMTLMPPIRAPRPNRVDWGPLATSTRAMSNSSTNDPRDFEIGTPS